MPRKWRLQPSWKRRDRPCIKCGYLHTYIHTWTFINMYTYTYTYIHTYTDCGENEDHSRHGEGEIGAA